MNARSVVTTLLFGACIFAMGQGKGQVRLFIDPGHNFEYILDKEDRLKDKVVELTTGEHHFTFWAPTRAVVDTVITVEEGEQAFYLRLPFSISYLAHERRMQRFKKKVFLQRSLPAIVTLGAGIWAGISYGKHRKAHNDLESLYDEYNTEVVPFSITKLKTQDIPEAKDEFDRSKRQFTIATAVFAVSAIGTAYAFIKTKDLEAPIFEDKAKIKFDGMAYLPGENGGMVHTGLTIEW